MEKLTYKQIIDELVKQKISDYDFAYDGMPDPLPNIGVWKEVDQHGGEGRGEDWWSVKHFPDHDVYIKISGYYSSGNGTDFEGLEGSCEEVKPIEKTITVYE